MQEQREQWATNRVVYIRFFSLLKRPTDCVQATNLFEFYISADLPMDVVKVMDMNMIFVWSSFVRHVMLSS